MFFFTYLENSSEDVLGDIVAYWSRFEYWDSGALGSLPHVHAGLSLKENSQCTIEELSMRVHDKISLIFNSSNKTDFESLKKV